MPNPNRSGDVLQIPLSAVNKVEVEAALDLPCHVVGDADSIGLRLGFQTRRDVYAITMNIVAIDSHIAQIDANTKADADCFGNFEIAIRHGALYGDRTFDSRHGTRELD